MAYLVKKLGCVSQKHVMVTFKILSWYVPGGMKSKYKRSVKSEQNWWDWKDSKMYLNFVRTLHYTPYKTITCLHTRPLTLVSPSAIGQAVFSILVKTDCPKLWRMNSYNIYYMDKLHINRLTVSRKKNTLIARYNINVQSYSYNTEYYID